jgi:endonuclease YncB( thermonuclease family)
VAAVFVKAREGRRVTAARGAAPVTAKPANGARERVLDVESGDTFSTGSPGHRSRTRIVGIQAPGPGECGFEPARRHLRTMIADRAVTLYWDSLQPHWDKTGRRLRYATLGTASQPWDVGYWAVASGWARVSLENDFLLVAEYLQAQARAQQKHRGIWACDRRVGR